MKIKQNLEVSGTGIFSENVSIPNATLNQHAVNKLQLDASIAALLSLVGYAIHTVEIDFGSIPIYSKTFDLNIACVAGQKVFATVSVDMPLGVAVDELEMDSITIAGHCTSANNVTIVAHSSTMITGKRNINILIR